MSVIGECFSNCFCLRVDWYGVFELDRLVLNRNFSDAAFIVISFYYVMMKYQIGYEAQYFLVEASSAGG